MKYILLCVFFVSLSFSQFDAQFNISKENQENRRAIHTKIFEKLSQVSELSKSHFEHGSSIYKLDDFKYLHARVTFDSNDFSKFKLNFIVFEADRNTQTSEEMKQLYTDYWELFGMMSFQDHWNDSILVKPLKNYKLKITHGKKYSYDKFDDIENLLKLMDNSLK